MSQDKKRDAIIEAALKRFAHFGVAKTTMSEIGADLAISKASLYYYFPDKINLYAAVLQSIIEQSQQEVAPMVAAEADPFTAIELFLSRRTNFIMEYYNLLEFLKGKPDIPDELKPVFNRVKERDILLIQHIIEKGCQSGTFQNTDTADKAALLIDCLEGMRHVALGKHSSFFPDKEQFLKILVREKELSRIFLKGLTC